MEAACCPKVRFHHPGVHVLTWLESLPIQQVGQRELVDEVVAEAAVEHSNSLDGEEQPQEGLVGSMLDQDDDSWSQNQGRGQWDRG